MRNYQQKLNNPYQLPHNLYMSVLYLIKDYQRIKKERLDILYGSPAQDGQSHQRSNASPTEEKGLKLAALGQRCTAIDEAIIWLNGKYSDTCTGELFDALEAFNDYGMFCYYRSKPNKETAPSKKTWNRYRSEFVYTVAVFQKLI